MALPSSLPKGYTIRAGFPSVAEYRHIRVASGLSAVTESQAAGAVTGGWYGCFVAYQDTSSPSSGSQAVGMGRIIGDGGWYFHIADMGVLPEHQRKGLGDAILKHLLEYIKTNAAEGDPYISLFADPPGRKLYAKNGFVDGGKHDELGMVLEKPTA